AYCVATIEFSRRQIPIAFLQRINEDFTKKYVGGKAATTATQSLNREFGSRWSIVLIMQRKLASLQKLRLKFDKSKEL
ncbi:Putative vesicle-associated membrane protein 726, partial [Glycine soja]